MSDDERTIYQKVHEAVEPLIGELNEECPNEASMYLGGGWELRRTDEWRADQVSYALSGAERTLHQLTRRAGDLTTSLTALSADAARLSHDVECLRKARR